MNSKAHKHLINLTLSAMFLALAYVLPFLTGQIPEIGKMLSPMHIPVMLCGFICGWPWGLAVGAAAPLTRSLMFSTPVMYPAAICMAFELAVYGALTGLLHRLLPNRPSESHISSINIINIYASLIISMIAGRIAWGTARFICAGLDPTAFGLSAFWTGAVSNAIPGIVVQLILIPAIMLVLEKTNLFSNSKL